MLATQWIDDLQEFPLKVYTVQVYCHGLRCVLQSYSRWDRETWNFSCSILPLFCFLSDLVLCSNVFFGGDFLIDFPKILYFAVKLPRWNYFVKLAIWSTILSFLFSHYFCFSLTFSHLDFWQMKLISVSKLVKFLGELTRFLNLWS